MHRILILDSDTPLRARLVESVQQTANTEVIVAADENELVTKVDYGIHAVVFADADLLLTGPKRILDAVRRSIVRPMLIIASNEKPEDLDPDLVTLIVHKPYDVLTLGGILCSAVMPIPPGADRGSDRATR